MLPEIETRAGKLVQLYADLEGRVQSVVASHVTSPNLTRRDQMRAFHQIKLVAEGSRVKRMAHANGLVRLAYVRGGRAIDPEFRLADQDFTLLTGMTDTFVRGLRAAENAVLYRAHAAFRFKGLGQQASGLVAGGAEDLTHMVRFFENRATVSADPTLEQYVRTAVVTVSEQAITYGELAATRRDS